MNITAVILALVMISFNLQAQQNKPIYLDDTQPLENRIEDALARMTLEEKIAMIHAQSKFSTPGCPRLGIPELWMTDGPHGIRAEKEWDTWKDAKWTNDYSTAFPALTCLAATFNTDLSYEYGKAIGAEARYRNKAVLLAPGVNIYRTPLNGRNFEYFGEDPYLASKMTVPYINGVQENGVAACIKHYALNNQETRRSHVDVEVSDRALYEIYLPAFHAAVKDAGVWSIMGAYNKFRGQYTSHHDLLINKILKKDWAFDGAVITDWGSAHDTHEAAFNGLDIEMGTGTDGLTTSWMKGYDAFYMALPFLNGIKEGKYPESLLDEKVRRVLRLTFRTVMNKNRPWGSFASEEHHTISRKIAEEGIVLLKNKSNLFPINPKANKKIVVIGENAIKSLTVGGGSSELKVKREISPLQGLINVYGKENITFTQGYSSGKANTDSLKNVAIKLAKTADVVLFIGGLNKNKGQDSESRDRSSYDLPYNQNALIGDLALANKNLGVVIISGNAVAMPWIDKVSGLIQSWYLGSEAGNALANVLSGKINPSGKLPFSIAKKLEDFGSMSFGVESYPGNNKTNKLYYKEDILVGYRWHDTKKIPAQFPFGYGLSYSTFNFDQIKSDRTTYAKEDVIRIALDVTNKGKVDGAEVAQIYVSQKNAKVLRPLKELKAFKKVFVEAGKTQKVELEIPVKSLAYYNEDAKEWTVDTDNYTISVGNSSTNIIKTLGVKVL